MNKPVSVQSKSSNSSSTGSVGSAGGPQKAKISSKKDEIKKLIRDINAERAKQIAELNSEEIPTQMFETIDNVFDQTVVNPQSTRLSGGSSLASLGEEKLKTL